MAFPSPAWHRPGVRLIASVILIGHLIAVFVAPLSFQTQSPRGNSPSVEILGAPVRGYGEFLYLNRGYAFFAPDPGPSHLVQAAIGDVSEPGTLDEPIYPDLKVQWPRLLYHRHFMLAEYLTEIYQPPGPPAELAEIDSTAFQSWSASRGRYEFVRQSYVRHLEAQHPGQPVAVRRLEHLIPDFYEFHQQSIKLADPSLYQVLTDAIAGQGDMTSAATEAVPAPAGTASQSSNVSEADPANWPSQP